MIVGTLTFAFDSDFARLRDFYSRALGVPPQDGGKNWTSFATPAGTFALHRCSPATTDPDHDPHRYHLTFLTDDIRADVKRFQDAGATILRDVQDEAFGQSALLKDPTGREFSIVQENGRPHDRRP